MHIFEYTRRVLTREPSVPHHDPTNSISESGHTALMVAVGKGLLERAKVLIESGEDVNAKTNDGRTVLTMGLLFEHPEAATLLISHGADVNAQDDILNRTALMIAAAPAHLRLACPRLHYSQ